MRCDTNNSGTGVVGVAKILHGADSGEQQCCHSGVLHCASNSTDPLKVGMGAEAVDARRTRKSVTVCNLDRVNTSIIECLRDLNDIFDGVAVTNGMHTVTQGDIADVNRSVSHHSPPRIRTAVASAADVMMSRLPA